MGDTVKVELRELMTKTGVLRKMLFYEILTDNIPVQNLNKILESES